MAACTSAGSLSIITRQAYAVLCEQLLQTCRLRTVRPDPALYMRKGGGSLVQPLAGPAAAAARAAAPRPAPPSAGAQSEPVMPITLNVTSAAKGQHVGRGGSGRGPAHHSCESLPLNRLHAWCELFCLRAVSAGAWPCPDTAMIGCAQARTGGGPARPTHPDTKQLGARRRIQAAGQPAQHSLPALLRARRPAHRHGAPRHEECDMLEGAHGQSPCMRRVHYFLLPSNARPCRIPSIANFSTQACHMGHNRQRL